MKQGTAAPPIVSAGTQGGPERKDSADAERQPLLPSGGSGK